MKAKKSLKGKRVLVTGATGGIGKALCFALVKAGCNLILVGRKQSKLEQLIEQLPTTSNYLSIEADVSSPAGISAINNECQILIEEGIQIDIVINNAGCNTFEYLTDRTVSSIEQEIAVNITAPITISKHALSWLPGNGIIVNIGSTFAAIGYPGYATYCATKAALHRFTEAMQRESDIQGTGQQILFIAPRSTNTDLNSQQANALNSALGNHVDSTEYVAEQVLQTLNKKQKMHWIGWPEKLFVRLNQLFPSLVSNSIYKQKSAINKSLTNVH